VIHHEREVREEQKYICVERATVRSFAHMPLGISDRINTSLSQGLAVFCIFSENILQIKKMRSLPSFCLEI